MKKLHQHVFCLGLTFASLAMSAIPEKCKVGKDCLIDVEGSSCADGTKSFFQLTLRPGAKNLLVYLSGGGACWDKKTCDGGYAKVLTRKEGYENWETGKGIFNASDEKNPFGKNFNIVTVPYCTGDVHAGLKNAKYGEKTIRHQGYQNVTKTLEQVKAMFDRPDKVVLLGCSAGGIGAYVHLSNLDKTYPDSRKFVVSDAGTPFKPPYLLAENYQKVMRSWGAEETLKAAAPGENVQDFGALIHHNTTKHSDIAFGFISSYRDIVMTFFALSVGSSSPTTAVKKNIIDVADHDIGREAELQKVYFTDSSKHCHTGDALSQIESQGTELGDWLSAMISEEKEVWSNVRPDLSYRVKAVDLGAQPRTIKELKQTGEF